MVAMVVVIKLVMVTMTSITIIMFIVIKLGNLYFELLDLSFHRITPADCFWNVKPCIRVHMY